MSPDPWEDPGPSEEDVLFACALRFDGWKYKEEAKFDHAAALDDFFATGHLPDSPHERLCTFFCLQRGLGRRVFRALFLSVADHPIPAQYAMGEYVEAWDRDLAPDRSEHMASVRRIQEAIAHDEVASPSERSDASNHPPRPPC